MSVAGTKFYDQADHDYTAVGFEQVATYQLIRVTAENDRLAYRAIDKEGRASDELVIDKSQR